MSFPATGNYVGHFRAYFLFGASFWSRGDAPVSKQNRIVNSALRYRVLPKNQSITPDQKCQHGPLPLCRLSVLGNSSRGNLGALFGGLMFSRTCAKSPPWRGVGLEDETERRC